MVQYGSLVRVRTASASLGQTGRGESVRRLSDGWSRAVLGLPHVGGTASYSIRQLGVAVGVAAVVRRPPEHTDDSAMSRSCVTALAT